VIASSTSDGRAPDDAQVADEGKLIVARPAHLHHLAQVIMPEYAISSFVAGTDGVTRPSGTAIAPRDRIGQRRTGGGLPVRSARPAQRSAPEREVDS